MKFQFFSTGLHWIQGINAEPPKAMCTEIMMNQSKVRVFLSLIRSIVMAKDVLLYIAAKMENAPATMPIRPMLGRDPGLIARKCFPKPRLTV